MWWCGWPRPVAFRRYFDLDGISVNLDARHGRISLRFLPAAGYFDLIAKARFQTWSRIEPARRIVNPGGATRSLGRAGSWYAGLAAMKSASGSSTAETAALMTPPSVLQSRLPNSAVHPAATFDFAERPTCHLGLPAFTSRPVAARIADELGLFTPWRGALIRFGLHGQ